MSPTPGSIHRRPRSDSGAARLWAWARTRRAAWTCADGADAADLSARRCRAIVTALHGAGLIDCTVESEVSNDGQQHAEYTLSRAGRAIRGAPIMIVDGDTGLITGVRAAADSDGTPKLRALVERSELATREAARRLQVHDSTLRRMLRGVTPVTADDPIIARARALS